MKKNKNNKAVSPEKKCQRRTEAENRCIDRRTRKLTAELEKIYGTSEDGAKKIDSIINDLQTKENLRTILCIYYGTFTVDIGEQEVEVKRYNKETNRYELVKEKKNVVLHGRAAAEYYIKEKKLDVLYYAPTHCYIKATSDNAEEIAKDLRKEIGRCYITKHKKLPVKEEIENLKEKPKKEGKPSYNTSERKKAAKAKRKEENKKRAEMRPYYAAWRKGGVNARIKKHNPVLADKIEKWIKARIKEETEKAERNKEYRSKHRQLTSIEMKANKCARRAAKFIAAKERRKEQELKRMKYNAKIREKRAQKLKKPVQTEIKEAA